MASVSSSATFSSSAPAPAATAVNMDVDDVEMDAATLFAPELNETGTLLRDLRALYAIDCSGSTRGRILQNEKASAHMLSQFVQPAALIGWGEYATPLTCLADLTSTYGGTYPERIIPFLRQEGGAQCFVLYTDGQISRWGMNSFKTQIATLDAMPVIVVFTLSSSYTMQSTIEQIERQVNMSVPEGCLAMSNDVCIAVNVQGEHKVLMVKGAFNVFGRLPRLLPETPLGTLADFDMTALQGDDVCFRTLPPGYIRLNGFDAPLSLSVLYNCTEVPYEVLDALCDRVYFPQLDTTRMHTMLSRQLRTLNENPEVEALAQQLADIAVDPARAGGNEHRALVTCLEDARSRRNNRVGADVSQMRSLIHRFLNMLNEYTSNRTAIALGSNRANRAKVIDIEAFDDSALGDCVQVGECPIYLQGGVACILLQEPDHLPGADTGTKLLQYCTNDIAMEAPFNFGRLLHGCVTRGVFCLDFARQATQNPFSRAPIIGYIPLSKDPAVVMRYMAKMLGDSREMWHFARAYIGMMVTHLVRDQWADRDVIVEHLQALLDNYSATYHLKGNTDDRRPLRACLEYVTTNYGQCLRDRLPDDTRTILSIVDLLMPDHVYERQKILAMVEVIEEFSRLLREYKRDDAPSMMRYVLELDDEYEHCVRERTDVRSVIARILWYDAKSDRPKYRQCKLQLAIDKALNDRRFGAMLRAVFAGEPINAKTGCFKVALPEPSGVHFGDERYGHWNAEGRPKTQCVYCGAQFVDNVAMYRHLRAKFGAHFYNGQRAVQHAIKECGGVGASDAAIFKAAKQWLYKCYGEHNGALHTQRCKTVLMRFIRKFKQLHFAPGERCGTAMSLASSSVSAPARQVM